MLIFLEAETISYADLNLFALLITEPSFATVTLKHTFLIESTLKSTK